MRERDNFNPEQEPIPLPHIPNQTTYLARPDSYPERFLVPDDFAQWEVPCELYVPSYHVDQAVIDAVGIWAEPEIDSFDELMEKEVNPYGRTGIAGRGLLGKWGKNPAVDGIVTRHNRSGNLELLTIVRGDNGKIALPGGFVDADESLVDATVRELEEETNMWVPESDAVEIGKDVYITSARNTDHAWVVTNAFHWHLKGAEASQKPFAGDDAADAKWRVIDQSLMVELLQTHGILVERVLKTTSW